MGKCVHAKVADVRAGDERLRSFISTANDELSAFLSTPSMSLVRSFSLLRQKERLKKRCSFSTNRVLQDRTIDSFIDTNELCRHIAPNLNPDVASDAMDFISMALERYTSSIDESIQSPLNLGHLMQLWRYGPGASRGTRFSHFADKIRIMEPSCTKKATPYALLLRKLNPHLYAFDGRENGKFTIVEGSSLSTVPKNEDTERTICTEPLMNMSLQLAAGMYIEGALRMCGLDISNQQDKNKRLAEIGSLDDSLATVDLKSASDLISIALIKLLWPPEWFTFFSSIRSESTLIRGRQVPLHMMGTMGNGFTFPMMTLTLLALTYATISQRRRHRRFYVDYGTVGVFGDDIILPADCYPMLVENLTDAGLIVNYDKSYSVGPFRESCGGDYYTGVDVTPFYVESLSSDPDIYIAINKIKKWSASNIYLPNTIRLLLSYLDDRPFFVPYWEDPSSGIHSGVVNARYRRWIPKKNPVTLDLLTIHENVALLMILGGYVVSTSGSKVCFSPRAKNTKFILDRARLPRGYLDGYDRTLSNHMEHTLIDTFLRYDSSHL